MKGIVFTEFLEMVEQEIDLEMVDQLIESSAVASKGIYTAVGTYPHTELRELITQLSLKTNTPPAVLLKKFGRHLFPRFAKAYPSFFKDLHSTFGFLECLDSYIHVEVRKLYPDAELPVFTPRLVGENMHLVYSSPRCMADFAEGLMRGA